MNKYTKRKRWLNQLWTLRMALVVGACGTIVASELLGTPTGRAFCCADIQ